MMIGGINGSSSPYMTKPNAVGGSDTVALKEKKKAVEKEIKDLKENDKIAPEDKKNQLAILQKKLQKIENEIQKASEDSKTESDPKSAAARKEKAKESSVDDPKNATANPEETQEEKRKKESGETGNLIDLYL